MICKICNEEMNYRRLDNKIVVICPNERLMAHKRLKEWKEQGEPGKRRIFFG